MENSATRTSTTSFSAPSAGIEAKRYVLADGLKYRREYFGGILYDSLSKTTRFFNHAAAYTLEAFRLPIRVADASQAIQHILSEPSFATPFIEELIASGVIAPFADANHTNSRMFFTDISEFPEDRLWSPLGVELELTLRCMRRCGYCSYDSSPTVEVAGQLDTSTYSQILRRLDQIGVCYIRFTGGDPLTREDTLDILSDADKLGFAIAIASDLTILTDSHINRLSALRNLTALQTTLDGPTAEVADEFRGHGNFRRVLTGIERLRRNGIPVIVGTVLTKHNAPVIYATAQLLARFDVAYCVSPLYAAGRGRLLSDSIPDDDDLTTAYEQFAAAVSDGLVRPGDPAWRTLTDRTPADLRHTLWAGQPWLVRSPDRLLRIDPFGRCYTSVHLKEVYGDDVYVGHVPRSDPLQVWHSAPLLNALRSVRQPNAYFGDVVDIRNLQKEGGSV